MCLLTLLMIALAIMITLAFAAFGVIGSVIAFIFADMIVCAFIVFMLMRAVRNRKKV